MIFIKQGKFPLQEKVCVPGSKYEAHRYLFGAALAEGVSYFENVPRNKDIFTTIKVLKSFGVSLEWRGKNELQITGVAAAPKTPSHLVDTGENGTLSRFLIPFAGLCKGRVQITSSKRMMERPMDALLKAVRKMGVVVRSSIAIEKGKHIEKLPVTVEGSAMQADSSSPLCLKLESECTSQYVSALLLCGGFLMQKTPLLLRIGVLTVSRSYIDMTVRIASCFGARITQSSSTSLLVHPVKKYCPLRLRLHSDSVTASYFMGMGALYPSVKPIQIEMSSVGEEFFVVSHFFKKMGCELKCVDNGLKMHRSKQTVLRPLNEDVRHFPDIVPTLSVCAAVAKGTSCLYGIGHLQYKESNRIEAIVKNLKRFGINAWEENFSLYIEGKVGFLPLKNKPVIIDPLQDHRIAMSMSLLSLVSAEVWVENEDCVQKSFPEYWEVLSQLGFVVEKKGDD